MSPSQLTQNSNRQYHRISSLFIKHCTIVPVSILRSRRLLCAWYQRCITPPFISPPTCPTILQDCVCWQEAETEGFVELSTWLRKCEILASTTLKEIPSQDCTQPCWPQQHFSAVGLWQAEECWPLPRTEDTHPPPAPPCVPSWWYRLGTHHRFLQWDQAVQRGAKHKISIMSIRTALLTSYSAVIETSDCNTTTTLSQANANFCI